VRRHHVDGGHTLSAASFRKTFHDLREELPLPIPNLRAVKLNRDPPLGYFSQGDRSKLSYF